MVDSGTPLVAVEEGDDVVTLRLNRPDKLNALDGELVSGLYASISDLAEDDRGVLLTGAGEATCAGMDLDLVGSGDYPEAHPEVHEELREAQRLLEARTAPSAIAGFGVLVGAGFSFSLRCDFVVVGEETTLSLPEIRYNIPVAANTRRLAELVGPRVAKEIALTGRELDPERLHAVGLVNDVVPEDEVEETARELVTEVAGYNTEHVAEALEAVSERGGR